MRFSIFLNARSVTPEQDRYVMKSLVDHTILANKLGFEAVFTPDHHFTGYAPWASDPMMFAAYLAALVPDMHLGFSVTSIPLHSPVRFVERVNILDQLTDGKVLIGVGSGTTPEEMIGFGVNYKEASALSDSNLDIAEQLWAKGVDDAPVKFDNGHYRGEVIQRIAPAPYTKGACPPDAGRLQGGQRPARREARLAGLHSRLFAAGDQQSRTAEPRHAPFHQVPRPAAGRRPQ